MAGAEEPTCESTKLLEDQEERLHRSQDRGVPAFGYSSMSAVVEKESQSPRQLLPLALLAALAMAATAATSIFAYASLLCKEPTHCQDSERNLYAGAVAVATCAANVGGLLSLGALERLSRENGKAALLLWFILRSMSVAMLVIGYQFRSIIVALSGQLFEGLASDNLLHFNLNAKYVQTTDREEVSRLIRTSLALYMVGISVSPFAVSYLENILVSFMIALGLFALSVMYLLVIVNRRGPKDVSGSKTKTLAPSQASENATASPHIGGPPQKSRHSIFAPLRTFYIRPIIIIPSLSLLLYNTGQAFIFPAIMVHTSIRFGFSAKQNGLLISIAHATSAVYLFLTLWMAPQVARAPSQGKGKSHDACPPVRCPRTADAILAAVSLTIQCIFLTLLGLTNKAWQVYPIVCFFALGLASPSFIKSHTLVSLSIDDAPRATAALAITESAGSLLAPMLLGGLQTLRPGAGVLYAASGIIGVSAMVFCIGTLLEKTRRP